MTLWTVQCGYAAYYAHEATVEAPTLEAALEAAIRQADDSDDWWSVDDVGPTFVDAVARGDSACWQAGAWSLPVPARFTERGKPPLVTVVIDGGLVRDVHVAHSPCRVLIRDYDVEGSDPERVERDPSGEPFIGSRWGDWPPDPDPEIPRAGDTPDAG
jgi:hypothetical protein